VQREGEALSGAGSEQSTSPSPVDDDEATTSRLELFQISALTDLYETDPTTSPPNLSVDGDSISTTGDASSVGQQPGSLLICDETSVSALGEQGQNARWLRRTANTT